LFSSSEQILAASAAAIAPPPRTKPALIAAAAPPVPFKPAAVPSTRTRRRDGDAQLKKLPSEDEEIEVKAREDKGKGKEARHDTIMKSPEPGAYFYLILSILFLFGYSIRNSSSRLVTFSRWLCTWSGPRQHFERR